MSAATPPELRGLAGAFTAAALEAVDELGGALTAAGITLPSLGVDLGGHPAAPVQLVELGRVRPDVALALAAAIRKEARP